MWMILASRFGVTICGIHGTAASSTSTTSARGSIALMSKPIFIGWFDAMLRSFGSACTTGIANSSASAASSANACGERPSDDVTMSGNSALAIIAAASSMASRDGTAANAPIGRVDPLRRVGVASSASTSRGSVM